MLVLKALIRMITENTKLTITPTSITSIPTVAMATLLHTLKSNGLH